MKKLAGLLLGLLLLSAPQIVVADHCKPPEFSPGVMLPGLNLSAGDHCVTFPEYFGAIYKFAISLAITLAVIMTIVAGYIYATSGGEPARLTIAKDIFISVVIGLSVLVLAGLIIRNIVAT